MFVGVCRVNMCGCVCPCVCTHALYLCLCVLCLSTYGTVCAREAMTGACACVCLCARKARARTTSGNPHCRGFRRKDVCSQGTVLFLKASSFKDRFVNISETNPRAEPCFISTRTTDGSARPPPPGWLCHVGFLGEGRGAGPAFILNSVSPSGTSSQLGWTSGSQYLLSLFLVLKGEETHSKAAISEEPGLKSRIKSPVGILPHRTPWTGCGR